MFKLFEIEFIDHPFFNSLKVEFASKGEERAENYTTLIIGTNGTGKSKLLLAIISIFNSLELISNSPRKKYTHDFHYRLRFGNKGEMHFVDFSTNNLSIDNIDYRQYSDRLRLPNKLLLSAFSFNDKYPLRESRV
jgi:predicted ATP-dependent endonuclease of OLD family